MPTYWQWITLVGTLLVAAIVARIIKPLMVKLVQLVFRKFRITSHTLESLPNVGQALAMLISSIAVQVTVHVIQLTPDLRLWCERGASLLISLFGLLTLYRLVDVFVEHFSASSSHSQPIHHRLVPLLRRIFKIVILVFGVVVVLEQFHVNLTAVVAGLSIGGAALALASQDTIRNLFGSFMIMTDRPFTVGDQIAAQGAEGVVEDIGLRSTRIRTPGNSIVSIPNGRLADMTIDNLGLRVMRRYRTTLHLSPSTSADQIEHITTAIREIAEQHALAVKDGPAVTVAFTEFGEQSLKLTFQVFLGTTKPNEEITAKQELNLAILRILQSENIQLVSPPPSPPPPVKE